MFDRASLRECESNEDMLRLVPDIQGAFERNQRSCLLICAVCQGTACAAWCPTSRVRGAAACDACGVGAVPADSRSQAAPFRCHRRRCCLPPPPAPPPSSRSLRPRRPCLPPAGADPMAASLLIECRGSTEEDLKVSGAGGCLSAHRRSARQRLPQAQRAAPHVLPSLPARPACRRASRRCRRRCERAGCPLAPRRQVRWFGAVERGLAAGTRLAGTLCRAASGCRQLPSLASITLLNPAPTHRPAHLLHAPMQTRRAHAPGGLRVQARAQVSVDCRHGPPARRAALALVLPRLHCKHRRWRRRRCAPPVEPNLPTHPTFNPLQGLQDLLGRAARADPHRGRRPQARHLHAARGRGLPRGQVSERLAVEGRPGSAGVRACAGRLSAGQRKKVGRLGAP